MYSVVCRTQVHYAQNYDGIIDWCLLAINCELHSFGASSFDLRRTNNFPENVPLDPPNKSILSVLYTLASYAT